MNGPSQCSSWSDTQRCSFYSHLKQNVQESQLLELLLFSFLFLLITYFLLIDKSFQNKCLQQLSV